MQRTWNKCLLIIYLDYIGNANSNTTQLLYLYHEFIVSNMASDCKIGNLHFHTKSVKYLTQSLEKASEYKHCKMMVEILFYIIYLCNRKVHLEFIDVMMTFSEFDTYLDQSNCIRYF